MKAAVCEKYGPPEVVTVEDLPDPVPGDDEVLLKVAAAGVSVGDARLRANRVPFGMHLAVRLQFGLLKRRQPVLGFDAAGQIEAVGKGVTRFRPGDRVVASNGFKLGFHAEQVVVAEDGAIALIPDGVGYQDAVALCFGGDTALDFLRKGNVAAGEKILINGASGAVGTMAVQLAKHKGAEVTGVCSAKNAELVRSLGADHVIDYATEDFSSGETQYDVIMDCHGNAPYGRIKDVLKPGGRFLMVYGNLPQTVSAALRKNTISGTDNDPLKTADNFRQLMALIEDGSIRSVIDSTFPLSDVVQAHRRVDTGHKVGSVLLTFESG